MAIVHEGVRIPRRKEPVDPNSDLDWYFDWTDWLPSGDLIDTATVFTNPSDGVTIHDLVHDGSIVTCWIQGWTKGVNYTVTCRITTTGAPGIVPRVEDRSFTIKSDDR